jgi:hypothetical protein
MERSNTNQLSRKPGFPICLPFDVCAADEGASQAKVRPRSLSDAPLRGQNARRRLVKAVRSMMLPCFGRTSPVTICACQRSGGQIPAPAMWRSLIARSTQSSMNSRQFALLAEIFELSDFEFFNGIGYQRDLAKFSASRTSSWRVELPLRI